jgi:membrane-bound lytic murein transglycosylase B
VRIAAVGFLPRIATAALFSPPRETFSPAAAASPASQIPERPLPAARETSLPPDPLDPAWAPLLDRLAAEGFARKKMEELFARLGPSSYSPAFMAAKISELYGVGGIDIGTTDVPPAPEGFEQPIADATVGAYRNFTARYAAELKDIRKKHGVPGTIAVAVLLVETGLGLDLGRTPALRSLAGMAATTTPALLAGDGNNRQIKRIPAVRLAATLKAKSDWAFAELVALIRYGENNNLDVSLLPGSRYGAVGICQFMPSNIAPYGLDGDGDGAVNLFSVVDALYSAANYLEAHGWRSAKTTAGQFAVLRSYNQDNVYAARVLALSRQLALADKGKGTAGRDLLSSLEPFPKKTALSGPRRGVRLFASARVQSLGSYLEALR